MTAQEIIKIVYDYYKLPLDFIALNSRNKDLIKVKHIAIYFCRHNILNENEEPIFSLAEIGKVFNLNHCSIIHALKSVRDQASIYKYYKLDLMKLDSIIEDKKNLGDYETDKRA